MPSSTFSVLQNAQSLTTWPIDYLVIGIFIALVTLDAFRSGTGRAASLSLALPITALLFSWLGETTVLSSIVGNFTAPMAQSVIFFVLLAIFFVITNRIVGSMGFGEVSLINSLLAGLACAIVLITFWVGTPALYSIWQFNSLLSAIFSEAYKLLWIIAAFIVLAFVRS